jgi:hypothetical protein
MLTIPAALPFISEGEVMSGRAKILAELDRQAAHEGETQNVKMSADDKKSKDFGRHRFSRLVHCRVLLE